MIGHKARTSTQSQDMYTGAEIQFETFLLFPFSCCFKTVSGAVGAVAGGKQRQPLKETGLFPKAIAPGRRDEWWS